MTKLQTEQGEKRKIGIFAYHKSCTFYHSPRSSDIASKILVSELMIMANFLVPDFSQFWVLSYEICVLPVLVKFI